jgi:hypothetical protein
VDQREPLLPFPGPLRSHALASVELGDQVQRAPPALGRIGEDLQVEPFDAPEIEARRPGREKQIQEFAKECLQQRLESLIVIFHTASAWTGTLLVAVQETPEV